MSYYVWVGPRDIDCIQDSLFSDRICYYSDKNIQSRRESNIYGNKFNEFIKNGMLKILSEHTDAKFIFYNPRIAYHLENTLQQHIQPMFSIFRPMKDTKLENTVPPSNQALLSLYQEITEICESYDLEPGPACKECRNNMLAI